MKNLLNKCFFKVLQIYKYKNYLYVYIYIIMAYQAFLNNRSMQQDLQQQFANITTEAEQTGIEQLDSLNQMKEAGLVSMQEQGTEREGMGEGALFLGGSSIFGAEFGMARESLGSMINNTIKTGISTAKNYIGDTIKGAYQNVKDTVTGKIEDLQQTAEDTMSGLRSQGQDMISSAVTKGRNLSQGLEESYSSSIQNLGDTLMSGSGTREMASRSGNALDLQMEMLNADPEINMALSNMGQQADLRSLPELAPPVEPELTGETGIQMTTFQSTATPLPKSEYITDEIDTSGKVSQPVTTEPGSLADAAKVVEGGGEEAAIATSGAETGAIVGAEGAADALAGATAEIPVLDILTGAAALGFGLFSLFDKPHTPAPPPPPLQAPPSVSQSVATVQSGV